MTADVDVAVVGAGVSGLALAQALASRGQRPVVLERARGVGGRCATRRVEQQPVDHGVGYLHGRAARFLAALDLLADEPAVLDWPRSRDGIGVPCQPEAFGVGQMRVAPAAGVSRLPKHLARGVEVRLQTEATSLRHVGGADPASRWELVLGSGDGMRARIVVLTMPVPSALQLLRARGPVPGPVARVLPLLEIVRMVPCLTVIARYPRRVAAPAWEASFPAGSAAIHTILNDSSKRAGRPRLTLVIQARPRFSRARMDEPVESWTRDLLRDAAALHGEWLADPELVQSHVWHHARVDAPSQLAGPLLVRLEGGGALGFCGDAFHPAGGVEGAYLSGIALADRIAADAPAATSL